MIIKLTEKRIRTPEYRFLYKEVKKKKKNKRATKSKQARNEVTSSVCEILQGKTKYVFIYYTSHRIKTTVTQNTLVSKWMMYLKCTKYLTMH